MQKLSYISQRRVKENHGCLQPFTGVREREIVVRDENNDIQKAITLYRFRFLSKSRRNLAFAKTSIYFFAFCFK